MTRRGLRVGVGSGVCVAVGGGEGVVVGEGVAVAVLEGVEDGVDVGVCVEVGVWEAVGLRVGAVVRKGDMVGDAMADASNPAMAGGSPQAARIVLSPASWRKVRRDSA